MEFFERNIKNNTMIFQRLGSGWDSLLLYIITNYIIILCILIIFLTKIEKENSNNYAKIIFIRVQSISPSVQAHCELSNLET